MVPCLFMTVTWNIIIKDSNISVDTDASLPYNDKVLDQVFDGYHERGRLTFIRDRHPARLEDATEVYTPYRIKDKQVLKTVQAKHEELERITLTVGGKIFERLCVEANHMAIYPKTSQDERKTYQNQTMAKAVAIRLQNLVLCCQKRLVSLFRIVDTSWVINRPTIKTTRKLYLTADPLQCLMSEKKTHRREHNSYIPNKRVRNHLGNLVVAQPPCFLQVAWQLCIERMLQLSDCCAVLVTDPFRDALTAPCSLCLNVIQLFSVLPSIQTQRMNRNRYYRKVETRLCIRQSKCVFTSFLDYRKQSAQSICEIVFEHEALN
ncbi:hypothetical protein CLF_110031 [Clonorchis sinensis]|uniref:Uncharacterized protein n=1 Tax=Clonorchis sinensis TaxID=79923 RepID=G7YK51_CLOSI|nr:hypothetical protein CLF_110031 [Clonorchis sinensis]